MNGEEKPASESNGRSERDGSAAFLPIGIVFFAVAIAMMSLGTTAWIAFFTIGITFLIIGMQARKQTERPSSETPRG
ncbi:hypothetical protein [Arthrobacter sp. CG_A4]|uniref:hypothetical protein n=1 Tax=Arthrobacter sp. CG_A4 TaxID=3071706 RepID=UPI002E07496E|nr:hypothetical protein [Arthrobacter sp. CG_A4]